MTFNPLMSNFGSKPGGSAHDNVNHPDNKRLLWTGHIISVDSENMLCTVMTDLGAGDKRHDVKLPGSAGSGPRSWAGLIPEVGTRVIIGWRKNGHSNYDPEIVEYVTVGIHHAKDYEPFSVLTDSQRADLKDLYPFLTSEPGTVWDVVRIKRRKAYSGDFLASSSGGSDFLLDRDVYLVNRAGIELRLRDSDRTMVANTINEFTSNAAGNYYRGLIKRSALSISPDVLMHPESPEGTLPWDVTDKTWFETKFDSGHPAYEYYQNAGLVNDDGTKSWDAQNDYSNYPHYTAPDGRHLSYVHTGLPQESFSTDYYVEDRKELKHTSDMTLGIHQEIDGVSVYGSMTDDTPTFIEDVHGTVVGNDVKSGLSYYKRLLGLRLFNTKRSTALNKSPVFDALIPNTKESESQTLARLYKINSPVNDNQYIFGVSKEGKVSIHIPSTTIGEGEDRGRSLDANIMGLVKAVIGSDPGSQLSAHLTMKGGITLNLGQDVDGNSAVINAAGPFVRRVTGGRSTGGGPTEKLTVEGDYELDIRGNSLMRTSHTHTIEAIGALLAQSNIISLSAGDGGINAVSQSNVNIQSVAGSVNISALQSSTTLYTQGVSKTVKGGLDTTTVELGIKSDVVKVGNREFKVEVGNIVNKIKAGNHINDIKTGSYLVSVQAGSLSLTTSAGGATINATLPVYISSATGIRLDTPLVSIGPTAAYFAVAGVPGPPGPAVDYLTGIPLMGQPNIRIG